MRVALVILHFVCNSTESAGQAAQHSDQTISVLLSLRSVQLAVAVVGFNLRPDFV